MQQETPMRTVSKISLALAVLTIGALAVGCGDDDTGGNDNLDGSVDTGDATGTDADVVDADTDTDADLDATVTPDASPTDCWGLGTPCTDPGECCSDRCEMDSLGDTVCQPGDGCLGAGETCTVAAQCCTLFCDGGTCAEGGICEPTDGTCDEDLDCCGNDCDRWPPGTCVASPSAPAVPKTRSAPRTPSAATTAASMDSASPWAAAPRCTSPARAAASAARASGICGDPGTGYPVCLYIGGCTVMGEICQTNEECCSFGNSNLPDTACSADGSAMRCVDPPGCVDDGELCGYASSNNCCSGGSANCMPTSIGVTRCFFSDTECIPTGGECSFSDECCDGVCAPDPNTGTLVCNPGCIPEGDQCTTDSDCCSGNCNSDGICGPEEDPCVPLGGACIIAEDCCDPTYLCENGICAPYVP